MRMAGTLSAKVVKHVGSFLKHLRHNQDGSLLPMVASSMMALTAAAGLAVDGSRMFLVKDVLQKSLDSAGLAAGHAMDLDNMANDAQEFFDANISSVEHLVDSSEMNIIFSEDNKLITLEAKASVSASFISLFGVNDVTVSASTEITRETRGMELVIVMDNTGSMRHGGKIGAAKDAAEALVENVYGDSDTTPNLWVGVVPYVAHVNVGSSHTNWLTDTWQDKITNGDYNPTTWMGCISARSDDEDLTDTPPSEVRFTPWFWEDEEDGYRDNDWIDSDGDISIYEANSSSARGPNRGCGQKILPLVESKQTVLEAIDDMAPWSFGGTASPVGLVWGWRVLSPRWQGLWGGDSPANLPLAHETPYMDKVLVVLTDGKNEFISRNSSHGGSDKTAYGTIAEWGFDSIYDARDELDDRFSEICTNIKTDEILIYAITFGNTPDSATRTAFENCASNPANYFHAPSNSELQDVFDAIGRQLSNLRLSK